MASLLLLSSCGKDLFSPSRQSDQFTPSDRDQSTTSSCSQFTLIKPKVDFLFVWDNSTSTNFITDETKAALNNTIDLISDRFDYHVFVAPLIGEGNDDAFFISENPESLSNEAIQSLKVSPSSAASKLESMPKRPGNIELGITRTIELLQSNIDNGIFRQNAYTIIVIMSNTDDTYNNTGSSTEDPVLRQQYLHEKRDQLLCLRGNYQNNNCSGESLNSQQMRFMSIVQQRPRSQCEGVTLGRQNYLYQWMSNRIYHANYSDGRSTPDDQFWNDTPDTYDICNRSDFSRIFDGINSSIQAQIIKHKYNYWPVATAGADPISPNEVRVMKKIVEDNGEVIKVEYPQLDPEDMDDNASGFTFKNEIKTVNTRFEPTEGEPFTGYVVELFGDAIVTYPECITVDTITPREFFGYIQLQSKPQVESIIVRINDKEIERSDSNGWQIITDDNQNPRYINKQNIRVKSQSDLSPGEPPLYKSGYFLKLTGDAIYSNGANIDVSYLTDGN